MGLFGNKKEGGLMDVIRCDEQEYLVWKWRPSGDADSTKKENAIRYGSSLRVKDGELAVFVYKQNVCVLTIALTNKFDSEIQFHRSNRLCFTQCVCNCTSQNLSCVF